MWTAESHTQLAHSHILSHSKYSHQSLLGLRVEFLRGSLFSHTKPSPPCWKEILWSEPFSDKLFQPFSKLDFQQPWLSWFGYAYAQKWRKTSNPNSFKQLKPFITYTCAPSWPTQLPMVPVMNAPCQAGLSSSWLTLLLTAVIQSGCSALPPQTSPPVSIPTVLTALQGSAWLWSLWNHQCSTSRYLAPKLSSCSSILFIECIMGFQVRDPLRNKFY